MISPLDELPYLEFKDAKGAVRRFFPDVEKSEAIDMPADITDHPTEFGEVTDNYRVLPKNITVSWFLSNTPIRGDLNKYFQDEPQGRRQRMELDYPKKEGGVFFLTPGGLNQAVTGLVESAVNAVLGGGGSPPRTIETIVFNNPPDRARFFYILCLELMGLKKQVTIKMNTATIPFLLIKNVNITKDGTLKGATVTLELKQISFASAQETDAIPLPEEPRAGKKKEAGAAGAEVPPEAQQSVLHAGVAGVAAALGTG